ncbi:MAG TPA: putative DNA-binding domain-containing protein [Burkholderiaceae bacterium]|nr:putative DNA-binding domain-containing protein [Burkholderiaceae bacterium]
MNEAARQQRLLQALAGAAPHDAAALGLRESGARAARGLEAYRANAEGVADRALASTFPTIRAMVGADDFARVARAFWHAQPPRRGDLGEWGDAFAGWLAADAALARWPWLADCARLDWALHACERAADAVLDAASLGQLESTDPAQLRLRLMPGAALLRSAWPLAAIHRAHQLEGAAAEAAFDELRAAIAAARGEPVFVARRGWRAVVHPLDAPGAAWMQDLLDGVDLAAALERAGPGFDFAAWLASALRESWLQGVSRAA